MKETQPEQPTHHSVFKYLFTCDESGAANRIKELRSNLVSATHRAVCDARRDALQLFTVMVDLRCACENGRLAQCAQMARRQEDVLRAFCDAPRIHRTSNNIVNDARARLYAVLTFFCII